MGLGRPARWLAIGLAGAGCLTLSALAVSRFDPPFAFGLSDPVAGLAVLAAWLAVPVAFVAGRRSRADEAKLSADLDAVSRRLLRLEAGAGGLGSPASPIEEIVEDIGSLSRVVKDLAEAAAGHERAIAALGTASAPGGLASEASPAERGPAPPVIPSFFPVREPDPERAEFAAPAPAVLPPARASHAGILQALEAGRIDLHVQPIVSLPQRQARFYESFALLQSDDGQPFVPAEFQPALERLRKLPVLDRLVVALSFEAAQRATAGRRTIPISCSLSAASLADPAFVAALEQMLEGEPADGRLVVELAQRTWLDADPRVLRRLQASGLSFGLGQIERFDIDPDALVPAGVRYVRIPARTIMDAQDKPSGGRNVAAAPELLAGSGLEIVAESVEDESVIPELIELRVPLAHGYAFALPSPVAAVFGSGEEDRESLASPGPASGARDGPEPGGYRPLREFLRRAG